MDERILKILEGDSLGLLKVKPVQSAMTEDERLVETFFEITDFYRQHGREPEGNIANVQEYSLAARLSGLRNNPEKAKALIDLDEFGLLAPVNQPKSIDDILNDDDLNLEYELLLYKCKQNLEEIDVAKSGYESLSRRFPTDARAYIFLAEIFMSERNFEKCDELLKKAEKIDSDFWLFHLVSPLIQQHHL